MTSCNCTVPSSYCNRCLNGSSATSTASSTFPPQKWTVVDWEKDKKKERIRKLNKLVEKWR